MSSLGTPTECSCDCDPLGDTETTGVDATPTPLSHGPGLEGSVVASESESESESEVTSAFEAKAGTDSGAGADAETGVDTRRGSEAEAASEASPGASASASASASAGAAVAPQEARVEGLYVDETHTYAVLPGKDYAVVPVTTWVLVRNMTTFVVGLPVDCLPFGFVERISVQPVAGMDQELPDFRVVVVKTNGARSSVRTSSEDDVYLTYGDMCNDNDAGDPAYKKLWDATGHNLKFRMIPGSMVVTLTLEFYGYPPSGFWVAYHGVNTVPAADLPTVANALRTRTRVSLGFPPLRPAERRVIAEEAAAQALADADRVTDAQPQGVGTLAPGAGEGSSVGAGGSARGV